MEYQTYDTLLEQERAGPKTKQARRYSNTAAIVAAALAIALLALTLLHAENQRLRATATLVQDMAAKPLAPADQHATAAPATEALLAALTDKLGVEYSMAETWRPHARRLLLRRGWGPWNRRNWVPVSMPVSMPPR